MLMSMMMTEVARQRPKLHPMFPRQGMFRLHSNINMSMAWIHSVPTFGPVLISKDTHIDAKGFLGSLCRIVATDDNS